MDRNNMQGEDTELGEKNEFKVTQGHENETWFKSQQNKLFWTVNTCFVQILFLCAFDKGKCKKQFAFLSTITSIFIVNW